MVRGKSDRSTTLIRSWSVSTVSPGSTATASWATMGPASTSAVTTWTVHPVTSAPASRAACTAFHPGKAGSSDGWVFSTWPGKASTKAGDRMVPKPAMATRSTSASRRAAMTRSVYRGRSKSLPKLSRRSCATGTPAVSATSTARQGRSTTTSPTSRPSARMASRRVPVPDASTASRTTADRTSGPRGLRQPWVDAAGGAAAGAGGVPAGVGLDEPRAGIVGREVAGHGPGDRVGFRLLHVRARQQRGLRRVGDVERLADDGGHGGVPEDPVVVVPPGPSARLGAGVAVGLPGDALVAGEGGGHLLLHEAGQAPGA